MNWTATTNDSWIEIVDGSGTGNGTVTFIVRDNTDERFRIGKITLAQRDYIVRQEGFGRKRLCLMRSRQCFKASRLPEEPEARHVVTTEECIWSATSNVGWVTITSDNGGLGTGALTFSVAVNSSGSSRKGTINISGVTFSVKQK